MKEINLAGGGGAISKCLGKITKLLVCKGVARKISHIYPIYIYKIPTHHHNDMKKVPSRSQVGSPPQLSSAAGAGTAQWTEWMTDISTSFQFLLLGIPKIKCGRALGTNNYSTSTNLSRSDHTSLFSSQKHGVQFYKIKSY